MAFQQGGDQVAAAIDKLGGAAAQINLDDLVYEVDRGTTKGGAVTGKESAGAMMAQSTTVARAKKYDIFLSHLQRNGQDAIIAMRMFLKQAHPGLRTFIDLEVDMKGDLTNTLKEAVQNCTAFLFFITDGILQSKWCAQELRWAVEYNKRIILVRETDERHGGLDMKNFFPQVPEDLMHVFQNIIAIPWYREPAFRSVSIRSILAAAQIEDTYAKDMAHLAKTRDKLEALVDVSGVTITAFDVIQEHSFAMKMVFFIGGFSRYRRKWLDHIYSFVFNISFWTCGVVCLGNMVYQGVPYHVFSTDILTAYVHIPAWHGWLVWRQYVRSPECAELLTKITARPEYTRLIGKIVRIVGWLVLFVQVAMVTDVLVGFSVPDSLDLGREYGQHAGLHNYTRAHSIIMYFVIPPVIASMFGSYCMFGFIALLHMLDVELLKETLQECSSIAARFNSSKRGAEQKGEGDSSEVTSKVSEGSKTSNKDDLELRQRKALMEDQLFEVVLDIISMLTSHTQRRIDRTCSYVSFLWVHLVVFSTMEVVAISNGFISHVVGNLKVDYRWWWGLQDFFHLGGGFVLLSAAMGLFCIVTASFEMVPLKAQDLFEEARCPQVRQIQVVSRITSRKYGMHILFGQVYIDVPKVMGFWFIMFMFLLNWIMAIINTIDAEN